MDDTVTATFQSPVTTKPHTQGVGDEASIAGALDFLRRSHLMSLPEDDSPATREQQQDGFVEAEEIFKGLEWMQPCNSQVFRKFRSRFALLLAACVRAYRACAPRRTRHLTVRSQLHLGLRA